MRDSNLDNEHCLLMYDLGEMPKRKNKCETLGLKHAWESGGESTETKTRICPNCGMIERFVPGHWENFNEQTSRTV